MGPEAEAHVRDIKLQQGMHGPWDELSKRDDEVKGLQLGERRPAKGLDRRMNASGYQWQELDTIVASNGTWRQRMRARHVETQKAGLCYSLDEELREPRQGQREHYGIGISNLPIHAIDRSKWSDAAVAKASSWKRRCQQVPTRKRRRSRRQRSAPGYTSETLHRGRFSPVYILPNS